MTLLLGPPGSGKTTLMRALAGQLLPPAPGDSSSSRKSKGGMVVGGSLTYNGLVPQRDFVVQRSASFVSQHDLHIGEMTVEETLTFAARCLGPGLNKRECWTREAGVWQRVGAARGLLAISGARIAA